MLIEAFIRRAVSGGRVAKTSGGAVSHVLKPVMLWNETRRASRQPSPLQV